MRGLTLVLLALALAAPAAAITERSLRNQESALVRKVEKAKTIIRFFQNHPKLLEDPKTKRTALRVLNEARAIFIRGRARLAELRQRILKTRIPPHFDLWKCIHGHERTAWTDGGAPYWGGMQVGRWFIDHYKAHVAHPPGMPNEWSPLEQMWFAERAYAHEGYSRAWLHDQWPPSRGACF